MSAIRNIIKILSHFNISFKNQKIEEELLLISLNSIKTWRIFFLTYYNKIKFFLNLWRLMSMVIIT